MNLIAEGREENSAYIQLLRIALYALAGAVIGIVLSVIILAFMGGSGGLTGYQGMDTESPAYLNIMRISQVVTTFFIFIIPPIWLSKSQNMAFTNFYSLKKIDIILVLLVILFMTAVSPVMEGVAITNQKMVLPEFLKPVENWMRNKEDELMKMTVLLLRIESTGDFFINLFIIALMPAVGEELFFRGALQRSFKRMFKNPHVAIWLTAFIFSAIHLQFFGFFPRMILGAIFGYIYLWTGSLWYAMLAHFLNNAYAVCIAWYMQSKHMSLSEADITLHFPWYGYVISLILSIFLLKYLKDKTTHDDGAKLD